MWARSRKAWSVVTLPDDRVAYGDYWIEATPRQLRATGQWNQEGQISRADDRGWRVQLFNGDATTFATREQAVVAIHQYGRDVIDGKVPNSAVHF